MRHPTSIIAGVLCTILGVAGCGKTDASVTKVTSQRVKVDAATEYAEVLGPGPIAMPDGKVAAFDAYELGQLALPSGRIIAADGFILYGTKPFTGTVRPGSYPVSVAVALLGNDQR